MMLKSITTTSLPFKANLPFTFHFLDHLCRLDELFLHSTASFMLIFSAINKFRIGEEAAAQWDLLLQFDVVVEAEWGLERDMAVLLGTIIQFLLS